MAVARGSLVAATTVAAVDQPRSSVSRAYYTAFAAAHAILLTLGESPRERWGTWSHESLGDALGAGLSRRLHRSTALRYKRDLESLRALRGLADYRPGFAVSNADAASAIRHSRRLLAVAKEFCP